MYLPRKISLTIVLIFSGFYMMAQFDTEEIDTLENLILYNKQITYGVTAHNLGLGVNFRSGKRLSIFKTRMLELEFVSMKSYKQIKLINSYYANARRYVYGKSNDAFFLRAGLIWKKLLNRKPYWGGVEVRFLYGGGFSLGIAKPYYLYVIEDLSGTGTNGVLVMEKYDPEQHTNSIIYGKAPFSKGLNEISLHPGAYFKGGLNFEFGVRNTAIKSLEIGACVDVLPTGLTIMAAPGKQYVFPGIYLNFSFGKRFNKY